MKVNANGGEDNMTDSAIIEERQARMEFIHAVREADWTKYITVDRVSVIIPNGKRI